MRDMARSDQLPADEVKKMVVTGIKNCRKLARSLLLVGASLCVLSACGLDAAGSAATAAKLQKENLESAQENRQKIEERLAEAAAKQQSRQESLDQP